jgi:23S rRNA (cytidine1920-2'-O)/16S rRNA (cytidine1409-2'-O)-methyltransferase
VTVDASFISLKILLPVIRKWLALEEKQEERSVIALIKPQFEAGKKDVARGDGVIRDPEIHRQVLLDVLGFAGQQGFNIRGLIKSPLLGPKGNAEFLVWLGEEENENDISAMITKALDAQIS